MSRWLAMIRLDEGFPSRLSVSFQGCVKHIHTWCMWRHGLPPPARAGDVYCNFFLLRQFHPMSKFVILDETIANDERVSTW